MVEGIQFDEPTYNVPASARRVQNKGISEWLIKNGLARDKKQAIYIMVIASIASIIVAMYFSSGSVNKPNTNIEILPQESIGIPQ